MGSMGGYAKARARERIREAARGGLDVASFLDEASSALASEKVCVAGVICVPLLSVRVTSSASHA